MNRFFGVVVPFLELVGVRGERWSAGNSTVTLQSRHEVSNHFGGVHGGAVATLLDVAMASAARSQHPENGVVTVSMTVNFLRSGEGLLTAAGKVRQSGRSLVFCEAEVHDEAGHLVATASGTFKIRRQGGDA